MEQLQRQGLKRQRASGRKAGGGQWHMQSLGAMAHFDFIQTGAYAYEQALLTIRRLKLPMEAVEEQFRRMLFNVVARQPFSTRWWGR